VTGSGGDADVRMAAAALLQISDLPGPGWRAGAVPDPQAADGAGATGAALVDGCAPGFPDAAVTAQADSERFTRAGAMAYSTAWVLASAADLGCAIAALGAPAFAHCFLAAVAGGTEPDPRPGAAVLLGEVVEPMTEPRPGMVAGHRGRLTAGTGTTTLTVHVDLLVMAGNRTVSLVFLADSPDPTPASTLDAVAGAIAGRVATTR
jgi:hypothetical protein